MTVHALSRATAGTRAPFSPPREHKQDETFSMVSLQRTPLLAAAEAGHAEA